MPVGSFDRTLAALLDGGTIANAYCARCGGSHPKPDKASGETVAYVHNRDMMAPQIGG